MEGEAAPAIVNRRHTAVQKYSGSHPPQRQLGSSQISRSPLVDLVLKADRPQWQRFGYRVERGLRDRNADHYQASRKSGTPARRAVCQAGRVLICFPPHALHRRRWPAVGTVTLSGRTSTTTSAERPQASQVAVTGRTPFWRMLARVMGGPGLLRMVQTASRRVAKARF
jgi:hypothetical protein